MSSENNGNDNDKSGQEQEYFYRSFSLGDFEVTFNFKGMKSPMEMLEKMHQLHENDTLTNEEKNSMVKRILNEYME